MFRSIPGATSSSLVVTQTGKYKCIISDSIKCLRASQRKIVTVIPCPLRLHDFSQNKEVLIYPNPANSHITIEIPSFESKEPELLTIRNTEGKMMFDQPIRSNAIGDLDISTFASGMYTVSIYFNNGEVVYRKLMIKH